nr:MAG TPA: hypothetical protein [Caudoviricetes sp.]DAM69876.1 MAG TPA: hypothetical protein [Caudoviricetes sp.]DAW45077.1 MAG TPA: hypothetical protein [Caudoviricetes sp.]
MRCFSRCGPSEAVLVRSSKATSSLFWQSP